jgi:DNA-binding response OmpR family regulator/DNA-binding CsgD family transcriptional regulator
MTEKKKAMILIVDDQPANLKVLFRFLEEQNLNVHILENGEQALEMLNNFLPDIILLDVMMPGMDGFTVCRKIKADKRTAAIPVIFLSALGDVEDKIAGFEAGGVDYITKPFQKAEVLARLNTQLTLQSAFTEIKRLSSSLEGRVQKRTHELKESNGYLKQKQREIEDKNIAMRVLLDQHQVAREELEDHMTAKLQKLVFPYLDLLHQEITTEQQKEYLLIIRAHLNSMTEPFTKKLSNPLWHLTPREVLVADLVQQGKSTREIGQILKISPRTAERYRNTIRKKIGLINKKISLHAYLCSAMATS